MFIFKSASMQKNWTVSHTSLIRGVFHRFIISLEPMARTCKDGEHFDALIRSCIPCRTVCQQPHVVSRCLRYCESARCTAKPGHYFDRLLKKCVRCAEICGKHPAECSQHCTTPPPVATKRPLAEVTKQVENTRVPPEPTIIQLYSLLAVCMVLLLSSLFLALVVFLRRGKTKSSNMRTMRAGDQKQKCKIQPEQELGVPTSQTGRTTKDFPTNLSYPVYREPSDDSNPIETCTCVHCFPDLRALGQDNDRLQRAPNSFYQQAVLHRAQNGGPVWTDGRLHNTGVEVQGEAAMRSTCNSV